MFYCLGGWKLTFRLDFFSALSVWCGLEILLLLCVVPAVTAAPLIPPPPDPGRSALASSTYLNQN